MPGHNEFTDLLRQLIPRAGTSSKRGFDDEGESSTKRLKQPTTIFAAGPTAAQPQSTAWAMFSASSSPGWAPQVDRPAAQVSPPSSPISPTQAASASWSPDHSEVRSAENAQLALTDVNNDTMEASSEDEMNGPDPFTICGSRAVNGEIVDAVTMPGTGEEVRIAWQSGRVVDARNAAAHDLGNLTSHFGGGRYGGWPNI